MYAYIYIKETATGFVLKKTKYYLLPHRIYTASAKGYILLQHGKYNYPLKAGTPQKPLLPNSFIFCVHLREIRSFFVIKQQQAWKEML